MQLFQRFSIQEFQCSVLVADSQQTAVGRQLLFQRYPQLVDGKGHFSAGDASSVDEVEDFHENPETSRCDSGSQTRPCGIERKMCDSSGWCSGSAPAHDGAACRVKHTYSTVEADHGPFPVRCGFRLEYWLRFA